MIHQLNFSYVELYLLLLTLLILPAHSTYIFSMIYATIAYYFGRVLDLRKLQIPQLILRILHHLPVEAQYQLTRVALRLEYGLIDLAGEALPARLVDQLMHW